jgi:hypothetical protein
VDKNEFVDQNFHILVFVTTFIHITMRIKHGYIDIRPVTFIDDVATAFSISA